jgi:hypothetical protein
MHKLYIFAVTCLMACAAHAQQYETAFVDITGTTTAATGVVGSFLDVSGPVVQMHVILGTATNVDVDIVVDATYSSEDDFTLYTADDVDADKVIYPVFDRTDSAGAALTSDQPAPFICLGDPITCTVSDWAQTGKTVRVKIVWIKN